MARGRYVLTPARRAALKKAQLASAKKRRKAGKRGSFARGADKWSKSPSRAKRAAAYATRGSGGKDSSIAYKISKKRGSTKPKNRTKKVVAKTKKNTKKLVKDVKRKNRVNKTYRKNTKGPGSYAKKWDDLKDSKGPHATNFRGKKRSKAGKTVNKIAAYNSAGLALAVSRQRGKKKKSKSKRKKKR